MPECYDVAVVGGGIVGLAVARSVRMRRPNDALVVLEKEREVAAHQTGHNSGVIHSGVYYRPGSLKARLCLEGRAALIAFAEQERVRWKKVGKLIVASRPEEVAGLATIEERARANGVDGVRSLGRAELESRLPGLVGTAAVEVPSAAIIDYRDVARHLAAHLTREGVVLGLSSELTSAALRDDRWRLSTSSGEVEARFVINCAGLEADLVAERMGVRPPVAIVPFRGDFYRLSERLQPKIPCLVYPVPDPELPFLGVHLTPTVDGELLAGPNAALALSREGYHGGQFTVEQLARMAMFPGTVGLARRYGSFAAREWLRSWSPAEFLSAIRSLWPSVDAVDLVGRSSGVRAQAVRPDGSLEDDFVLVPAPRSLHVLNAPSPAATAALAIGEAVTDRAGLARVGGALATGLPGQSS